jgi:hypothetical protein
MAPLPASSSRLLRCFTLLAGLLLSVVVWSRPAQAEPTVMPQPALLPHYSPLCDSNLIGCLDIDDFAAHLYGHLMVLPSTDQRDTAAVFPYGVSMGLFGRFGGGVSTDFSFWQAGGKAVRQNGPLRLNLPSFSGLSCPSDRLRRQRPRRAAKLIFSPPSTCGSAFTTSINFASAPSMAQMRLGCSLTFRRCAWSPTGLLARSS